MTTTEKYTTESLAAEMNYPVDVIRAWADQLVLIDGAPEVFVECTGIPGSPVGVTLTDAAVEAIRTQALTVFDPWDDSDDE